MNRREFLAALGALYGSQALAWAAPREWFIDYADAFEHQPAEQFVKTLCPMCPGGCGLKIRVVHGCAVGVRGNESHPINRGGLCSRALAVLQDLYNPDRLRAPLQRIGSRGEDRWQQIGWDEAVGILSDQLGAIRVSGSPQSLAVLLGRNRGLMRSAWQRFMRAYGSPNLIEVFPDDNLKVLPAVLATQGIAQRIGYDIANASFVLSFSSEWLDAHWSTEQAARLFAEFRRGRPGFRPKWIHLSPRHSITAAKADEWLPINPGSEGALALAIAHVLIREGLYDRDFVAQHGYGFEDWTDSEGVAHLGFRRFVLQSYAPLQVQQICGVPEGAIFRLAREFGTNLPAIAMGYDGGGCGTLATYDRMAIHCLNALAGSIDVPGGVTVFQNLSLLNDEVEADEIARRGLAEPRLDGPEDAHRLATNAVDLLAAALNSGQPYPTKAVILADADPVFASAQGAQLADAWQSVPFIAAFSGYHNDSTRHADLIIPMTHGLHRWEFDMAHTLTGSPVVTLAQPVIPAAHDMKDPYDVLHAVGTRLGEPVSKSLPWSSSSTYVEAVCRELFDRAAGAAFGPANEEQWAELLESRGWRAPFATNFESFMTSLLNGGGWTDPIYFHHEWDRVFKSPAQKFAFSSRYLRRSFEALAPQDDMADRDRMCLPWCSTTIQEQQQDYPLSLYVYALPNLVSVSSYNLPWLNDVAGAYMFERWRTWVEVHPYTAEEYGIAQGEYAVVRTKEGTLTLPVQVYAGLKPGVIAVPFGFGHKAGGRWCKDIGENPADLVEPRMDPLAGTLLWNFTRASIGPAAPGQRQRA